MIYLWLDGINSTNFDWRGHLRLERSCFHMRHGLQTFWFPKLTYGFCFSFFHIWLVLSNICYLSIHDRLGIHNPKSQLTFICSTDLYVQRGRYSTSRHILCCFLSLTLECAMGMSGYSQVPKQWMKTASPPLRSLV